MSTIHIIEPDAAILGGLIELLSSLQLPVCGHTSPAQFLAADHDNSGGFLVVDFDARDGADFDFLKRLRERDISMPTVLISSNADNAFKARALNAGAIDVIDKPFVNDILLARIRQYLPEVNQSPH
ncbi:MAG: response regulator [Pseudomonadales bacterium]